MTVRNFQRLIEGDGWVVVSHERGLRQFKHPIKPGRVTIAGHTEEILALGTLSSILRQAGLKD